MSDIYSDDDVELVEPELLDDSDPLPAEIEAELLHEERIIEQGLSTFIDVGRALEEIRDRKLYKVQGYKTFDAYTRERWGWERSYAYRQMEAAELAETIMMTNGNILVPMTESQMRALMPLKEDPDTVRQVWDDAVRASDGRQPTAAVLQQAVKEVAPEQDGEATIIHKGLHPAPYSAAVLHVMGDLLDGYATILDPFAGIGGIHQLRELGHSTLGIELEPEWAEMHEGTICGDALRMVRLCKGQIFDAIATSPTYGNRLADAYDANDPESRSSYEFDLGRPLTKGSSGAMQWGHRYRGFHERAWIEAEKLLRPGGRFVLNIKDHIRSGKWQDVAGWHIETLVSLGLRVVAIRPVVTRGIARGANADTRVPAELVVALDKPNPRSLPKEDVVQEQSEGDA